MLHAVFALYACRECTACELIFLDAVGWNGHKQAWQETGTCIENATEKLFGNRLIMDIKASASHFLGDS
jgi:hypothetical protein